MENFGLQVCQLLPGFRFHPTDQELIIHYLRKKVLTSSSTPATTSIIADIDLYKYNPWELPDKSLFFGELAGEWFFFSPRDRKYPNGGRPNRAAGCGYWKATGTDKPILAGSGGGSKCLGVKKALVFYKGRPPKGFKTDWVMHEYRLIDATPNPNPSSSTHNYKHKATNSMRLDDWVLCRVRQKGCTRPIQSDEKHDLQLGISTAGINQQVPAAPMIINNSENKQQLPAVKAAGNSTCTVSAGVINNSSSSSSDFYEWSEDQLLAYLMSSSSQQEEAEAEGLGESTCTSTDHNSRSTNSSSLCLNNNNNNISNFLHQGHAAAAAATNHYMQPPPPPPQAAVSSMLDSIKRTLSFGALDELLMLQPPSKSLHYYYYINANGDDQLSSPTSSFSVDQAFPDFGM